jgi:hypothetical protein
VFHDARIFAIAASDEMLVGDGRQRLAALVANLIHIALRGQHSAEAFTMSSAIAIGEDFGVAFIRPDDTQAARPRHARLCLRHGVMDFELAAAPSGAAENEPNRAGDLSILVERYR